MTWQDLARKPAAHKDFISSWLRLEKCSVNSHLMTQDAKSRELKRVMPGSHCEFLKSPLGLYLSDCTTVKTS